MKKGIKKFAFITTISISIVSFVVLLGVVFSVIYAKNNISDEFDELLFSSSRGTTVTRYYVNNNPNKDGGYIPILKETMSSADGDKVWVAFDEFPEYLKSGFIACEDRQFYNHHGVDVRRTLLATANSVLHFDKSFGASTITQQVVKNISGDSEVTLKRKYTEILRAIKLEKRHDKKEIFELYMNIVPMGENLVGVASAAECYFGKSPYELSLAECATLVGITNAPTKYNPHENSDNCLKKRNDVLYAMLDFGVITQEEYENALNSPLNVVKKRTEEDKTSSWFVETVNEDIVYYLVSECNLSEAAAKRMLYSGGLSIYTTMDVGVQNTLESYFENKENFPSEINNGLEFSAVVCDSKNGDLLGIVGCVGKKNGNRLLNLALTPHAPGSSLKPIALYAPLINSNEINYATVFDDVPVTFVNNIAFPKNYPGIYDGLTTVKDGLRLSKNTVAVRLYNKMGGDRIYRHLKGDFGFNTLVRRYTTESGEILSDIAPSPLALGQLSYGVSLRKLTEAYTVFPTGGKLYSARSFIEVYDNSGKLIINNEKSHKEIYKETTAEIMNKLLMNVTESGTASTITLKNLVDTAGKTGTSGDDKDRLFVGYTPYLTMGIWCGYRDSSDSIGKIAPTHLKIWDNIMCELHREKLSGIRDEEILSFSEKGLIKCEYCKDSGCLFTEKCLLDPRGCRMETGYFTKETVPKAPCNRHKVVYYDMDMGAVASHKCPMESLEPVALIIVEDRHFPCEVTVTDAEYVYRKMNSNIYGDNENEPYFMYELAEGDFAGKSKKKRQFNSYCYAHNE